LWFNPSEWVLNVNPEMDEITLKPIFASKFSESQLFKISKKVLLMSGTILDKKTFCRNVGIPEDDCAFLSTSSPFPVKNRPVFIMNGGSMSYKNINSSLPKVAKIVKDIINADHRNDKGIIHAQSYKIANYLKQYLKSDRIIVHDSSNRIEMYEQHINSKKLTILISPSFTEGIDLINERSRFQIIVKIPFPFLGDNYTVTKMKRVPDWYAWNTIKTIVQSSGRSIRSKDDYAITYILDSDWNFLYFKNKHMFPKWWNDAIIKV
jgi:Rad3-related DNA helicase